MLTIALPMDVWGNFLTGWAGAGPVFFAIGLASFVIFLASLTRAIQRRPALTNLLVAAPLIAAALAAYLRTFHVYEAFDQQEYRALVAAIEPARSLLLTTALFNAASLALSLRRRPVQ